MENLLKFKKQGSDQLKKKLINNNLSDEEKDYVQEILTKRGVSFESEEKEVEVPAEPKEQEEEKKPSTNKGEIILQKVKFTPFRSKEELTGVLIKEFKGTDGKDYLSIKVDGKTYAKQSVHCKIL